MIKMISKKVNSVVCAAKAAMVSRKAEGYVDTGVKVLIAVVLGTLVLTLLYGLFNTTIMPTVTEKVTGLFSYTG